MKYTTQTTGEPRGIKIYEKIKLAEEYNKKLQEFEEYKSEVKRKLFKEV